MNAHAVPQDRGIFKMQNPHVPGIVLEWHPLSRIVYVLRVPPDVKPTDVVHADPICQDVDTATHAQNVGRAWFGAYREAKREIASEARHIIGDSDGKKV